MKLDGSTDSGNCGENRYTPVRLISLLVIILSVSIFSYLDEMKNIFQKAYFVLRQKKLTNIRPTLKNCIKKIVSNVVHYIQVSFVFQFHQEALKEKQNRN